MAKTEITNCDKCGGNVVIVPGTDHTMCYRGCGPVKSKVVATVPEPEISTRHTPTVDCDEVAYSIADVLMDERAADWRDILEDAFKIAKQREYGDD